MTYSITWTNRPPRTDLERWLRETVRRMQHFDGFPSDDQLPGLLFAHVPILEDDYDGPAIFLKGNGKDGVIATHEPVTEGGGLKNAIRLPNGITTVGPEKLPAWLQKLLDDSES